MEAAVCETCAKAKWYAAALGQQLRDEAEFNEYLKQPERDARKLAAYWIGRIFEDWPGKYVAYPDRSRR